MKSRIQIFSKSRSSNNSWKNIVHILGKFLSNWLYHRRKYEIKMINKNTKKDKRINQRKHYSGHIFFVGKNGFNEGRLKDFSRSGLFINTKVHLPVGEIITIAIPFLKYKKIKCRGQILRRTKEGFGIELFRKRSAVNLKIIKWGVDAELSSRMCVHLFYQFA